MAGTINLSKGTSVKLEKTGSGIVATNGWTAEGKDYDLKALVRYHDGRPPIYVGAANRDEVMSTPEGAVVHGGDMTEPGELERITITWHTDIASVALSSYSAIENGAGSFQQYGVFVNLDHGGQVYGISAADASAHVNSYTCCFGEIIFNPDGSFTVSNLEMYSKPRSENRIGYHGNVVVMDAGPRGQTK